MKNKMKVVLADTDESFRMMLQRMIEAAGDFRVVGSVGSGADAWYVIERECPQLVIMDVILPELDGFGLLDRMAAMAARPRAILVSAFCQGQVVSRAACPRRGTPAPPHPPAASAAGAARRSQGTVPRTPAAGGPAPALQSWWGSGCSHKRS